MDKPRMEDLVAEHCDHFVSYLREGVGYMNNAERETGGERERGLTSAQRSPIFSMALRSVALHPFIHSAVNTLWRQTHSRSYTCHWPPWLTDQTTVPWL